MKTIRFTAFLFYRYYSTGRNADSSPYFRTLCSMTFLGFMHLFQLLIILDNVRILPIAPGDEKWYKRLVLFLVMIPIYAALTLIIKKRHIEALKEKYVYDWDKVFKGNVWLTLYVIASFALIIILALVMKKS